LISPIDVAVGMMRRKDGAVLMASRPPGKPYEGYWEFPGGKFEPGESGIHALARELHEEIGVQVLHSEFAWMLEHRYAHAHVQLHFYWITRWEGTPHSREHQQIMWVKQFDAWPYPVLPATVPLLQRVRNYTA